LPREKISADVREESLRPPAKSTSPEGSLVAVCHRRAVAREGSVNHWFVEGSRICADFR